MYERLDSCPVCKHTHFLNHMICDDHSISKESFALVKCSNCQLVFTNPRPDKKALPHYYKSDNYVSHTDKGNSLINILYKFVRNITLRRKISLATSLKESKGKLLDYGCGTGDFVNIANKNGWEAVGYEPDSEARLIAERKNTGKIIPTISEIGDQVDLITAWHVIEHVSDLKETLKDLRTILKANGHMIIALPNHKSFDAKHYGSYWAAYDVPRHLYHFDQESVTTLAKELKLKIVDKKPMMFDSYYVSILSEKYKKKGNLLDGIKIGYKSNSKAKANNEYSSLIYILKK